jgi:hypothetical protein
MRSPAKTRYAAGLLLAEDSLSRPVAARDLWRRESVALSKAIPSHAKNLRQASDVPATG